MKILWLSHVVPYPPKRGVLLRAHNLVLELSKHHDVDLLALNQKSLIVPYLGEYRQGTEVARKVLSKACKLVDILDSPADKGRFTKIKIALLSLLPWKYPYTIEWLQSVEYRERVLTLVRDGDYDLVHCDTISLVPYLEGLAGFKKTLDHHNVESQMLLRRASMSKNLLKKLYFYQEGKRLEQFERKRCEEFDSNIMCSDLDADRLKQINPKCSTFVAPNSVDIDFFKPSEGIEVDPATFLFVGTLSWYPNLAAIRYLVKHLWSGMKALHPEIEMHVIGANPPDDLVEFAEKEKGFHIHGFVDDLKPFFARATGYLCPISDGGGTKLKLLDAFASGKAVIAHPVACEGLMMTDNLNVLQASSPEQFLTHMSAIIESPALRTSLEYAARRHAVEQFSSIAIGKALADHFSMLCSR